MKRIFLLLGVLLIGTSVYGQSAKVVSAWNNLEAFKNDGRVADLVKAMDAINIATEHEKTKVQAKTWYYRGLIYSELAKNVGQDGVPPNSMDEAVLSFETVYEHDTKKRFSKDATNGLLFISGDVYNAGAKAFEAKEYETAYKNFMKMLDINDMNNKFGKAENVDTPSLFAASMAAQGAGMTDKAVMHFNELIDLGYKNATVYSSLTNIYLSEGKVDEANKVMAAGRAAFPENSDLAFAEINYLLKEGKDEEAKNRMEKAVEMEPKNANLRYALGTVYDKLKDNDMAIAAYEKAVEINPEYHDAFYNLGAVYFNQAVVKVTEMNELDINDQTNYDRLKGESDELFKAALPSLERSLELKEDDQNTMIALSEIYARLNMFDKLKMVKSKMK